MNRIKDLRKEHGMSQLELAQELNVHQTAVSQWETDKTTPDILIIGELAVYFDVSIEYLLGKSDDRTPIKSQGIILTPDEYTLIEKLRKLEPAKRAAFETLLD